ncbi:MULTISPECIES: tRNA glutamyl-Q(34) synthetase GluQRS [Paenibacillus]
MMQHNMPRGRFAPTPSGKMHIGNALIALLSWLQMRSADGQFVLRIEDIDVNRSREDLAEALVNDLKWLGLDWDEGPDRGGPCGPYRQSLRQELYEHELQKLHEQGLLYPCYCSRADIAAAASAPHGLASEGKRYPGTCRRLSPEEAQAKAVRKQPSLRIITPEDPLLFQDGIAGVNECRLSDGGDFVVKRADGIISYQLAVVVDDALMGITHVLRGADLLDSTPRQLLLYQKLGYDAPSFAHAPLIVDAEGRRLAKRSRGLSLSFLRAQGIRPQHVVGWLAWSAGLLDRPEDVSPSELVGGFDLSKVRSEPIRLTDEAFRLLFPLHP